VEGLELDTLALSPLDERIEVDVRQPCRELRVVAQVRPQRLLAVDPHHEEVELLKAAERGVPQQSAVELEAAQALGHDGEGRLDATRRDHQATHDPLERLDVLGDARRDAAERLAQLGAGVPALRAARDLAPQDPQRELIVHVDGKALVHNNVLPQSGYPARMAPLSVSRPDR
jgi:hypothetical protein